MADWLRFFRKPKVEAGAATPQPDPPHFQALASSLAVLDDAHPGWGHAAWRFVVAGERPELLLELERSSAGLSDLVGKPGSLYWHLHHQDKRLRKLGEDSRQQRRRFYEAVKPDNTPVELLVRLGKLLAAADQKQSLLTAGTSLPDWLSYLLNDGSLRKPEGYSSVDAKARGTSGGLTLSLDLLEGLLQVDDVPDSSVQLLQLVFERKAISSYQFSLFEPLLALPDLDAVLLADLARTRALPARLSAQGRVLLAGVLARPSLAPVLADVLVRLAVDESKQARTEAGKLLEAVPLQQRIELLDALLRGSDSSSERLQAADCLSRTVGADSIVLLQQALVSETHKSVRQAITQALSRLQAADQGSAQDLPQIPDYARITLQPLGEDCLPLLLDNLTQILVQARAGAAQEIAENTKSGHRQNWQQKSLAELEKFDAARLTAALRWLGGVSAERPARDGIYRILSFQGRLAARADFSLCHLVRLMSLGRQLNHFFIDNEFQQWLRRQQDPPDLRTLADVLAQSGVPLRQVAAACLRENYQRCYPQSLLPPECVWPFFAEHPEFLDESLGLLPSQEERHYWTFSIGATLEVIATLPTLPSRLVPRLFELALGDTRSNREAAQSLLTRLPQVAARIAEYLDASGQELRSAAAQWLGEIGDVTAIAALQQALAKESRETVRAALLTALERLGVDISPMLAPELLLAEATKGLKARLPAGLNWFAFDALPRARWAVGNEVAPEILRWWVVLATKLKEPGGNGLLDRYLASLSNESRAELGESIVSQFIAQDTRSPSLEQAIAVADAGVDARLSSYQSYAKWAPELAAMTREQVHEQIKREHLSIYLGSAIGEKGMLALISGVPGHRLSSIISAFMRDHYTRRSQIEALLEGAANSSDPAAMQLLLGVARRHRTASVQTRARALVERAARRLGWDQEQLADRTIPSAGFDEHGELELEYGERRFVVQLDEQFKAVLKNADGKLIKALPEPRKSDAPEAIKLAKSLYATCRKELKQVVDAQTLRLYEAMCSGRRWPQSDWREYLHGHPIVGRLCQRLLWIEYNREKQRVFRPSEDGALLDVADDEIALDAHSVVGLAHAALLDAAAQAAWKQHLKDYKVKPLFAQLGRPLPQIDPAALAISDRVGYCADTFSFRGGFTKLGYQRAPAEDGGCFFAYFKDFASIGVRATIEFSGSVLPEQNLAAALKELSFERLDQRGDARIALGKLPPVLAAETYADYLQIADVGSGFDANWEQKMPW